MKMNFVRPKDEPKPFQFDPKKVCVRKNYVWNSFSGTPKKGEKCGHYSYSGNLHRSNG